MVPTTRVAGSSPLPCPPTSSRTPTRQVNTSSVVLRKLMEGRAEGEQGALGAGGDVASRWAGCGRRGACMRACCAATAQRRSAPAWRSSSRPPPPLHAPSCPPRLLERGRKYAEKLAAAQRQAAEAPRDAATGRPLFQPKTHRAPQWERNPEGGWLGAGWWAGGRTGGATARLWSTGRRQAARHPVCNAAQQLCPLPCPRPGLLCSAPLCPASCLLPPAPHPLPCLLPLTPPGAPIGEYLHSIKAEWDEKAARVRIGGRGVQGPRMRASCPAAWRVDQGRRS